MHRTTGDNYALDSVGNRVFTAGPPPTTLDEGWANAVQEEIARAIEASGQTLYDGPGSDVYGQLALAIQRAAAYDAIVYSQETFNAIWTRTGANAYKINDGLSSVYFKAWPGGYLMSGPSSPLSNGDTWGVFSTNECTFIMCDGGCSFQMGDTPSYWSIATSNTVVYNMDVRGVGAVAAAVEYSIRLAVGVVDCKLLFCTVQDRISSSGHICFLDDENASILFGVTINNCENTAAIQGNGIYGFFSVIGGKISNLTIGAGGMDVVTNCTNVAGCKVQDNTFAANSAMFSSCDAVTGCVVDTCSATGGTLTGFASCDALTGCQVLTISNSGGTAQGIASCNAVSGCKVHTCTSTNSSAVGFYTCVMVTGGFAREITSSVNSAYGFYDCDTISGCRAYDIETSINNASYKAVGFQDCNNVSACQADTIAASAANAYAYGFNNCDRVSACHATTVTASTANRAYGFNDCDWMDGSNEATSIDDFEFYDCSQEPFRGNAAAATPYGYTEVWTSMILSGGVTSSYTPAKDGILFGFVEDNGASIIWSFRNGAAGKTVDQKIFVEPGNAENGCFSMPIKGGVTLYVTLDVSTGFITLRHMPFGTTT